MYESRAIEQDVDSADLLGGGGDGIGVEDVEDPRSTPSRLFSSDSFSALISVAITRPPSATKASTDARPIPCAAAVISAVLPANRLPIL